MSKKFADISTSETDIIDKKTINAASISGDNLVREQILLELAYHKAEQRGFINGNPTPDWFEAHRVDEKSFARPLWWNGI